MKSAIQGVLITVVGCMVVLTGCMTVKIGQPKPEPSPKITAWMAFWDWDRAMSAVKKNSDIITELMPFWYDMDSSGNLFPSEGIPQMREKGMLKTMDEKEFVEYCHRHKIKVLPLISNEFKKERVHAVLSNESIRNHHIEAIMKLVLEHNFDGVDIDYEGMMREDRDPFSKFLQDLGEQLHAHDKILSAAIHAKFSEPGSWDSNIAHDYVGIGKAVDRVRIMAYDEHYSGGSPGPIASIDWMERIVSFAVTVIPPEKMYLGVPVYGINWGKPKELEAMNEDAVKLARQYKATVNWDTSARESWFTYTDSSTFSNRTVWFEDGRSFDARWDLVKRYHLGGVSLWRLGGEDPKIWRIIRADRFVPPGHVGLYLTN